MGIGLAVAVLLLVAGEARAGKYAVAQCGWYVGADADWADTHRRRQVPPRRLLRAAGRGRPLRRRPPEEPHPRRPGHRLRHPLRPLALGGAAGHRDHARCAAPGGTRSTTGSSSGSASVTWRRRLRRRSWPPPAPTSTPREFVAGFTPPVPAFEDRLLCARAESKWCSLEPGSWSAPAGADDHGRGRRSRPAPGSRRRHHSPAAGAAAARASSVCRRRRRLRGPLRRDHARRRPRRPDRVPLREGPDRRRVAGDPDAALPDRRLRRRQAIATTSFSDGPHTLSHCATDFAGNVGCAPTAQRRDRQQPAGPSRAAWRSPAARAGAGSTTSTSPGPTPTRGRPARSGAPTGGSPAPPASTPASSSPPARDIAAIPDRFVPGARRSTRLQLWLRDEAGNDAPGLGG